MSSSPPLLLSFLRFHRSPDLAPSPFSGGRRGELLPEIPVNILVGDLFFVVTEVVETLAPNMNTGESDPAAVPTDSPHGIEVGVEFKPVEHPVEPVNLDQPVKCPLPEPSILHDGRIWKERMSTAGARVRTDLPVVKEGSQLESDSSGARSRSAVPRRAILPSVSAPEHNILALLEECDVREPASC